LYRFIFTGALSKDRIIPITIPHKILRPILVPTIGKSPLNAKYVDTITIGLTIGVTTINVIAAPNGTPFFIKPFATGTMAQSQTGTKNPAITAVSIP